MKKEVFMRNELFALEKAAVSSGQMVLLHDFDLHIYRGHTLGIICSTLSEKDTVLELFHGRCSITGAMRFNHETPLRTGSALFNDCFFVINPKEKLIPTMSIAENICLFSMKPAFVRRTSLQKKADQFARHLHIQLDFSKTLRELNEKELVYTKLLKAYAMSKKIVILQDLSAILNAHDLDEIYEVVRILTSEGMTFVVIDSPESTVYNWCEKILLVRNGTSIGCFQADFCRNQTLLKYISSNVSHSVPDRFTSAAYYEAADDDFTPVLEFKDVCAAGLKKLSFSLYPGALLKIHCLDAKSINMFRELVTGKAPVEQGTIRLHNRKYDWKNDLRRLSRDGIMWCPELPYRHLLYPNMTVLENILYGISQKTASIWRNRSYRHSVIQYITENIGADCIRRPVADLEPAQQQMVAYTKILLSVPTVVFFERPYYHTDAGIKSITLSMMTKLQERKICIVVLTNSSTFLNEKDGEIIYIKDGCMLSETEMYQELYFH